ncbi:hypothetical protein [Bradyrhizobium sp. S69]|jgi:hypothetical protein|uniref:hypothetical protein n=1 Tax=Bradyrhizobium sp. S69 TaxID=1641856 RepID=UPI00131C07CD|nr:hypothetical protein [Bradyrhizobium sp. S69]
MTDSPDVLSNDELPALRFLLQFCLQFGAAAGPFNNLGFDSNWNCPPNAKSSATVCIKKPASANPRWTAALFPLWVINGPAVLEIRFPVRPEQRTSSASR